ncbi:MAG: HNH nuclease family protein [Candidatus Hydrogenedens sp.]|jgi:hypothetical protein|nr:HNH nuclease family protein [Candidatus Hydrogenedens sp.]
MIEKDRKKAFLDGLKRDQRERDAGYRAQALKMFPHVCEKCGREFSGKNLRELTVHHKDGNHFNNPSDGSNWAMLCLYCHDDEHGTLEQRGIIDAANHALTRDKGLVHNPFENLKNLFPAEENDEQSGEENP